MNRAGSSRQGDRLGNPAGRALAKDDDARRVEWIARAAGVHPAQGAEPLFYTAPAGSRFENDDCVPSRAHFLTKLVDQELFENWVSISRVGSGS